jgi:hypothetical protein
VTHQLEKHVKNYLVGIVDFVKFMEKFYVAIVENVRK